MFKFKKSEIENFNHSFEGCCPMSEKRKIELKRDIALLLAGKIKTISCRPWELFELWESEKKSNVD